MLFFLANVIGAILGAVGIFVVARFTPNALEILGLIGFGIGLSESSSSSRTWGYRPLTSSACRRGSLSTTPSGRTPP